jgi:tetratricopeptide (TPR) repeat protein
MRYGEFGFTDNDGESTIRREEAAIAVLDRAGAAGRSARIDAQSTLAYGYYLAGQNRKADETYAVVMKALEDAGRDRTAAAADVLNNWALVHFRGDIARAEPLYRRALELRRSIEGTDSVSPTFTFNVAGVLLELGRYAEAEPLYEQVIRTARERHDDHIEADATMQFSELFVETGSLDRAAAQLLQVQPLVTKPSFDRLRRAQLPYYEGRLAFARGESRRARDQFAESAADFEKMKFKIALNVSALIGLARAELALGHGPAAKAAAGRAITLAESFVEKGAPSYLVGQARAMLGEIEIAGGNPAAARSSLALAIDDLQRTLGPDHPKAVRARRLAESLASQP